MLVMIYLFGMGRLESFSLPIYLHIGTLFAALVYFRREFLALAKALPSYRFRYSGGVNNLMSFLLFSTLLSGFIGYFIFKLAEKSLLTLGEYFTGMIGVALIITGLLQKYSRKHEKREIGEVKFFDTILLGVAQGFSAFPGISRSGVTISTLLFREFKSESAIKLSFLMSVPAVLIAELGLGITEGFVSVGIMELTLGCLSSFLIGLLSIHLLVKATKKIKFWGFCILIGVLALLPTFSYMLT